MTTIIKAIPFTNASLTTPVYTVPAGKTAILASLIGTNNSTGTLSYGVSVAKAGGGNYNVLAATAVTATSSVNLLAGKTTLEAGDSIYVNPAQVTPTEIIARPNSPTVDALSGLGTTIAVSSGGGKLVALSYIAPAQAVRMVVSSDGGATWVDKGSQAGMFCSSITNSLYFGGRHLFSGTGYSDYSGLCYTYDGEVLYSALNDVRYIATCPGRIMLGPPAIGATSLSMVSTNDGVDFRVATANGYQIQTGSNVFAGAWDGSRFIAPRVSASSAAMVASTDGLSWSIFGSPIGNTIQIQAVAYAGGTYFAFPGSGTTIYTSPDAVTWTARTVVSGAYRRAAFGAGTWVITGGGNTQTSTTLATWITPATVTGSTNALVFGNSRFLCGSNTTALYTSTDAVTWSLVTTGVASAAVGDAVWTGSQFVAVGTGFIITSPDGVTWTTRSTPLASPTFLFVGWTGTKLVAAGGNVHRNALVTSSDGITWTAIGFTGLAGAGGTYPGTTMLVSNGAGVLAASTSSQALITTSDFVTWTTSTNSGVTLSGNTAFANGLWVSANNTNIAQTANLSTWTISSVPQALTVASVASGSGSFFLTTSTASRPLFKSSNPAVNGWSEVITVPALPVNTELRTVGSTVIAYGSLTLPAYFSSDGFLTVASGTASVSPGGALTSGFIPWISGNLGTWITTAGRLVTFDMSGQKYTFSGVLSLIEVF